MPSIETDEATAFFFYEQTVMAIYMYHNLLHMCSIQGKIECKLLIYRCILEIK